MLTSFLFANSHTAVHTGYWLLSYSVYIEKLYHTVVAYALNDKEYSTEQQFHEH